ncbi:MAG: hypothetical protein IPO10_14275 [Flavobacteriales bacterium]|nr:hypothetical protein [Flavobacteriales bacterium]
MANNNFTCVNISGTALGATQSQPATCGGTADDDVWYKFVALGANYSLSVDGNGDYDGVLEGVQFNRIVREFGKHGLYRWHLWWWSGTKQLIGLDIERPIMRVHTTGIVWLQRTNVQRVFGAVIRLFTTIRYHNIERYRFER